MNILFLSISHFSSVNDENIYMDLMHEFCDKGHHIYMVSPIERKYKKPTQLFQKDNFTILQVKVFNIQKTNIVEKGFSTLTVPYLFKKAIKKYYCGIKFDLIIYTTPPITFSSLIKKIKNRDGAKTYLLLKDIFPQNAVDLQMFSRKSLFYKYFRAKEKELYAISDYIGCMSPANKDFLIRYNNGIDTAKIEVCPNAIKVRKSFMNRDEKKKINVDVLTKYGLPTEKIIFVYGGNLGKPQGIHFLLDVIDSNRWNKSIYFLIVGFGTEYSTLLQWFNENNPTNAKLLHSLPKSDYDELVASCDVGLIFLDNRFTIPNYPSRLLSYLENGLPILAATDMNTDIGKIAEENGYGYWCKNGSLDSFNHLLERYSPESINEMGIKGYQYLVDNYSVDRCYDIIMKHFK